MFFIYTNCFFYDKIIIVPRCVKKIISHDTNRLFVKEFCMKMISRTIAIILVMIMVASSFVGCFTFSHLVGNGNAFDWFDSYWGSLLADVILTAAIFLFFIIKYAELPNESGIYLTNFEDNQLTDYNSLIDKFKSLSEEERDSLINKINSLSEEKLSLLEMTINNISEMEINSSIKRLDDLSEKEFATTIRTFNSLSEVELNSVINSLSKKENFQTETKNVVKIDYSPVNEYVKLCLKY